MTKQKFTVYVHVGVDSWNKGDLSVSSVDMTSVGRHALISTHEIELDVPEYDLVQMEVDGIDKTITQVRAEFQGKLDSLEQRKQELLAIGSDGDE